MEDKFKKGPVEVVKVSESQKNEVDGKKGTVVVEVSEKDNPLLAEYAEKNVDELLSQISEILKSAEEKGYVRLDDFIKVFSAVEALRLKLERAPVGVVSVNVDELANRVNSYDVLLVDVEEDELLKAIKYYSTYSDKFQKIVDLLKRAVNDPFVLSVLKGNVLLSDLEAWVKKSESLDQLPRLVDSLDGVKNEVVDLKVALDELKGELSSVDEKVKRLAEEVVESKVKAALEGVKEDVFVDTTNKINSLKQSLKESLKETSKQIAQKVLDLTDKKVKESNALVLEKVERLVAERIDSLKEQVKKELNEGREEVASSALEEQERRIEELSNKLVTLETTISDYNLRTLIQEIVSQELSKLTEGLSLGAVKAANFEQGEGSFEEKRDVNGNFQDNEEDEKDGFYEEDSEEEGKEVNESGGDKVFYVNVGLIAINLMLLLLKIL